MLSSRRYSLPILLRPRAQATQRLTCWAGARRLVYNLVVQQWHDRRSTRDRHRPMSYPGLCRELTELRDAYPFLAAVPVHVLQQAAKDALDAIHKFYQGLAHVPTFKSKRRDPARMRFPDPATFTVDAANRRVRLPKVGWIAARFPRPLGPGDRITSLTVRCENGRWMARAAVEAPSLEPLPATGVSLGLDLGVVQSVTASDGAVYQVRDFTADERDLLARLQWRVARCQRGSRRQRTLRQRVARLHTKVANRRRHDQHHITTALIARAGHLVIEDLHVSSMTASAAGTVEAHGSRVAQKAGLNRSVLGVGFAELRRQLTYKSQWRGRRLSAVPAPHTSQTCARCYTATPENRETQANFRCVACGYVANADVNAAQVILQRGLTLESRTTLAAPETPARVTKARQVRRAPTPTSNAIPRARSTDARAREVA